MQWAIYQQVPSHQVLGGRGVEKHERLVEIGGAIIPPSLIGTPHGQQFPSVSTSHMQARGLLPDVNIPVELVAHQSVQFPSGLIRRSPARVTGIRMVPGQRTEHVRGLVIVRDSRNRRRVMPAVRIGRPASVSPFEQVADQDRIAARRTYREIRGMSAPHLHERCFPVRFPPIIFFRQRHNASSSTCSENIHGEPPLTGTDIGSNRRTIRLSSVRTKLTGTSC